MQAEIDRTLALISQEGIALAPMHPQNANFKDLTPITDWHCHLLPGLDDGPATIEEALEMAAALKEAGFGAVYCTPHLIKGAFDADNGAVLATLADLQFRLKDENIDLSLLPGREYYLDDFLFDHLKNPLTLGGTRYVLVELPAQIGPEIVKDAFFKLKCRGFVPMIAHPERSSLFSEPQKAKKSWLDLFSGKGRGASPGSNGNGVCLVDYLKDLGCAFQGNLGSFTAFYGPDVQKTAGYLKGNGVFTHFGTDAHSARGVKRLRER